MLAMTGQPVARTVAKASSHEVIGPKRKHIEGETMRRRAAQRNVALRCTSSASERRSQIVFAFPVLISLTHNPTQSLPLIGDELFARSQNTSWVVVFKALITCHNVMIRGHEVRGENSIEFRFVVAGGGIRIESTISSQYTRVSVTRVPVRARARAFSAPVASSPPRNRRPCAKVERERGAAARPSRAGVGAS